jgi:methionine synthase I (cobalamin-dependent)
MADFLKALQSGKVLLMDGAMGTELQRAGLKEGESGELWNITQPEKVRTIHQSYVDAGAEVLLSNTFQANHWALAKHGLENQAMEIVQTGLDLARSVAGPERFVILDIGPKAEAKLPHPIIDPNLLKPLIPKSESADAILLETFSDIPDFFLFLTHLLAERCRGVPALVSFTYQRAVTGKVCSRDGQPPEWFARQAKGYNVAAVGVNCGRDIGMDEIIEIIRRYRKVTDLPLFARPNAGTPTRVGDRWVYPHTAEKMVARLPELLEAGVAMVGGCCGTTPEHIAAFRPVIDDWNAKQKN